MKENWKKKRKIIERNRKEKMGHFFKLLIYTEVKMMRKFRFEIKKGENL